MTKQNLLVVDADPRSLRVLEVSLRNAGYNVAGCPSVGKALEILHTNKPDLILSETAFNDMDGFEFVEQLRDSPEWSDIPFMFLSSDESIESKIRGLELGVEDYLTKPIYIREVIARVGIELARQAREGLARRTGDARTRFSGSLTEMSVVDLLQTIDVSRKSGVLNLTSSDGEQGLISFDSGAVIHAAVDDLRGEDAVYRLLLMRDGSFDLEFRPVSLVERTVHRTTQAMLMEGMRRLDEWSRLSELLPPFSTVLEVDGEVLRERLHDTPDDHNTMVRLIDGSNPISDALRAHGGDYVDALRKLVDLYFEGIIREVGEVKGSIPVLAEARMPVSTAPPREPVDTIPGPGPGPQPSLTPIAIPAVGRVPFDEAALHSEPTVRPSSLAARLEGEVSPRGPHASDRAPAAESEQVPTPESLASPRSTPASDGAPKPASKPATESSAPDVRLPSPQPPTVAAPPVAFEVEGLDRWAPAPAPSTPTLRDSEPGEFQDGGSVIDWAGRAPEEAKPEGRQARKTMEVGEWDRSLEELRADPEVAEAIAIIDSEPPPGPFVRSTPPRETGAVESSARPEQPNEASPSQAADHRPGEPGQTVGSVPISGEDSPVHSRPTRVSSARATVESEVASPQEEPTEASPPATIEEPTREEEERRPPLATPPVAPASTRASREAVRRSGSGRWVVGTLALGAAAVAAYLVFFDDSERRAGEAALAETDTFTYRRPASADRPSSLSVPRPVTGTGSAPQVALDPSTVEPAVTPVGSGRDERASGRSALEDSPSPAPDEESGAAVDGGDSKTSGEDSYEAQLELARRLKRGSRATAAYRRAIELNPKGGEALAEFGRLQLARGHTREAAQLAERATALDPSNALAWVVLGASRQDRGDSQGARQAYRSCVKLGKGRYVQECRSMLR